METLILVVHIIASIALILFILLQSGKGGGVSAAFGGGAGAALGQRSAATVLGKATVVLSITFGLTSMSLAILSTQDRTTQGMESPAPAPVEPKAETESSAAKADDSTAPSAAAPDEAPNAAMPTPTPEAAPSAAPNSEMVNPTAPNGKPEGTAPSDNTKAAQ